MEGSRSQGDPWMALGDWRSELSTESRKRITNKIMETLEKHLPFSGPEEQILSALNGIAVRFEEKVYAAATSQAHYVRTISLKMLSMESKSSNMNPLESNSAAGIQNSQVPALHSVQEVRIQGQPLPISLPGQAQARQPILPQNVQNPVASGNVRSTSNMPAALPSITGTTGTSLPSAVSQGSTFPSMSDKLSFKDSGQGDEQNTSSVSQTQNQGRLYEDMASPQQHQQQPKRQKRSCSHVMGKGKKRRMSRAVEVDILCSICLDPVMDNGDRSTAKLRCGHPFHLDCIGSAFNAKASMQCPTCRTVENGQWLFSEKYHAFPDSDEDDWTERHAFPDSDEDDWAEHEDDWAERDDDWTEHGDDCTEREDDWTELL